MSNITFGQLPNQTSITATTIIPTVSANTNYTVTVANLQAYINANSSGSYSNANVTSLMANFGSNTITTTGNVSTGQLAVTGTVSATGNITGNYFLGNGSQLTGINAGSNYSNANVSAFLPTYSGNIGNLTITGTTVLNPYVETTNAIGTVSTSFTPTMSNGPVQTITLTGNLTLNAPSGMTTGQSITLIITQPSSGNAFMTANSVYKFAYGTRSLSTAGNAIDMMGIFYSGTTYLVNLAKGYI